MPQLGCLFTVGFHSIRQGSQLRCGASRLFAIPATLLHALLEEDYPRLFLRSMQVFADNPIILLLMDSSESGSSRIRPPRPVVWRRQNPVLTVNTSQVSSSSSRAFWACRRFSASSHTTLSGRSITEAVTSSPRWAGRQCMNSASLLARAMSSSLTW
jgi:hypothetical protein